MTNRPLHLSNPTNLPVYGSIISIQSSSPFSLLSFLTKSPGSSLHPALTLCRQIKQISIHSTHMLPWQNFDPPHYKHLIALKYFLGCINLLISRVCVEKRVTLSSPEFLLPQESSEVQPSKWASTPLLLNWTINGSGGLLNELINPLRNKAPGPWTHRSPGP